MPDALLVGIVGGLKDPRVSEDIQQALTTLRGRATVLRLDGPDRVSLWTFRAAAQDADEIILVLGDRLRRGAWKADLALLGLGAKTRIWEPLTVLLERARSTWMRRTNLSWWQLSTPSNLYLHERMEARRLQKLLTGDIVRDAWTRRWQDTQTSFLIRTFRWEALAGRLGLFALYHLAFWLLVIWGWVWAIFHRHAGILAARRRVAAYAAISDAGSALFKSLEGNCFSGTPDEHPSSELGLANGALSNLHFRGRKIDLGIEYIHADARIALRRGTPFRSIVCGDVFALPVRNDAVATLYCVHTVDHFPRLEPALAEMGRVIRPGGTLHLSGITEDYPRRTLWGRCLLQWAPHLYPAALDAFLREHEHYNLLPPTVWAVELEKAGLKMIRWRLFVSNRISTAHAVLSMYAEHAIGDAFPVIKRWALGRRFRTWAVTTAILPWHCRDEADSRRLGGSQFYLEARKI